MTDGSDEVLTEVDGNVGLITLNRPKAINSLNQPMIDALSAVLTDWARDDKVRAVLLSGAGERGLCAGGDVVSIYHSARKDGVEARRFWRDEYQLNAQISEFAKPYVAVMDGIVMGGGVGVSAHANTRVVTDTSKVAMPEVGIGFIPDVGGVYLLSRAPGGLGLHAALTGAPFSGADAIAMGFADHYVPHADVEAFRRAVVADGVESALAKYAVEPPPGELAAQRDWIDECYAGQTVEDIVAALRRAWRRPGARRRGPDRHPLTDRAVGDPGGSAPSGRPADTERRSGAGLSGVVGVAALTRSGGGHPGAADRQGPQSAVVARPAGRRHRGRRRGVFRPGGRRLEFLERRFG